MSVFDDGEVLIQRALDDFKFQENEKLSWDKFHNEMIAPRLKKLIDGKPIGKFAVGVYVPTSPAYEYGVAGSIKSLCDKIKVGCCVIDCRTITSLGQATGYLYQVSQHPFSMIIVEHFDEIPDSDDKKYIENILLGLWERDFMMKRSEFAVIFTTSQGDGVTIPHPLKKIKRLEWYGNIRKELYKE
jgi:hypothetical protein